MSFLSRERLRDINAKVPTWIFVMISWNWMVQHLQNVTSKLICAKVCTLIAKSSKWKRFAILQCICVGLTFFSQLNLSEMLDYGQNQWPNSGQVKCSAVLVLHLKKLYQCAGRRILRSTWLEVFVLKSVLREIQILYVRRGIEVTCR